MKLLRSYDRAVNGLCRAKRRPKLLLLSLALMLSLTACKTVNPTVQNGNADRLMRRPDFPAAKVAAKEWCRDALYTITDLEAQLKAKAAE